jgi:tRNA-specific 2-thiouridylase
MKGKKVFVGLSGGVDSAVTAALLLREGAEVTGVFIKGAYPEGLPCTWADDRRDAMRVAAHLGIPFLTLDASSAYRKAVIDYLVSEYAAGRTPNPDVMCNREVKFGAFYDCAIEHGADYIATGHYARIQDGHLLRGADEGKDQSYFLWAVPKETLPRVLFPLGGMKKDGVRALARKFNLPNAQKRDSQGICFLGNVSIEDFLRSEVGLAPGKVLDESGAEIGTHAGAIAYTLGERIAAEGGPWYVVRKDLRENTVTAARSPHARVPGTADITLAEANWQVDPEGGKEYEAQYRYHGPRVRGTLRSGAFTPAVAPAEILAPGQSLVIYDGEVLVGGGIIAG